MLRLSTFFALVLSAAATPPRRLFHVAPHEGAGDDAADGSAAAPMTIAQARRAVRSLLAVSPDAAVEVRLAHGDYFNVSLRLTERDSGDVIWRGPAPEEGATATIYGGSKISGPWTRATAFGEHVWQVPLPTSLLDTDGRAVFRQLVQGERSTWLAREPDFGAGFLTCGGNNAGFTCGAGVLPKHFDCVNSSCSAFTRAGYSSDIRAVTGVNFTSDGGAHVSVVSAGTSASIGSWYLQGPLELLDREGEWAVRHGNLYFWPYSAGGEQQDPNNLTITAPVEQQIISLVGKSRETPVTGVTLSNLRVVGSSMPLTYVFMCRGQGPGTSPGAPCAADGGPDTPDETNTSPRPASQGMIYLENATAITVRDCALKAAGIAALWLEEANVNHTISGNWVEDIGGFGLYANGIGPGDARYTSADAADVNHGHTITNNLFTDGGRQIEYGTGVWLYQSGSNSITHNRIHRFPRDGVGFYGILPFWTADPNGPVAPGMPPANSPDRMSWGKRVTWNGGNGTYSQFDILYNKNNYLGYNDISSCNRQGLDGGVVESWGSSVNNTWEYNAVHDNEGYGGLSIMFADDFTPSLSIRANILFENNCAILSGNCANFMMKSVNISATDNIVADSNYTGVFEVAAYRMPAANMVVQRNILWNSTQSIHLSGQGGGGGGALPLKQSSAAHAYTCVCGQSTKTAFHGWDTATLGDLISTGDGTNMQRQMAKQIGFSAAQLAWPVVSAADGNFVGGFSSAPKMDPVAWLQMSNCSTWDRNSRPLKARPFDPVGTPQPYHSRTHLDYAIANTSAIVELGFEGAFDVSKIGLLPSFVHELGEFKRRDAFGIIQSERYDRTKNLWTFVGPSSNGPTAGNGIGSGTQIHFHKDPAYSVPPGSWARYDGVDFRNGGERLSVEVRAQGLLSGARVLFKLHSPDASGLVLASVDINVVTRSSAESESIDNLAAESEPGNSNFRIIRGAAGTVPAPAGVHPVFMVFETLPPSPPPPPNHDDKPHRYWRLMTTSADFNTSVPSNNHWDVCSIELRSTADGSGPSLSTMPSNGFSSHGSAGSVFTGVGDNCTQWDGSMGGKSKILNFGQQAGYVGYDFERGVVVRSVRIKQFPNQYCAATPALQYSEDKVSWQTKWRLNCAAACPNNATAAQAQDPSSWTLSPKDPGSVAPPGPPHVQHGIGALIDYFRFTS